MTKISKTAQSIQAFITECKAHGFDVEVGHTRVTLVSHFQPRCFDSFNLLNRNGSGLLYSFEFTDVEDSHGVGAQVALDTGVIVITGRTSKRFLEALKAELCLG